MKVAVNNNAQHGVEKGLTLGVQTVCSPENLDVSYNQPRVLRGADKDVCVEVESSLLDSRVGGTLPLQD